MTKPEWGTKRTCISCNARFYDMQNQPIVCPKCETVFDPEALNKKKRGRPPATEQKKQPAPPPEPEKTKDLEIEEEIVAIDDDDELLEDTSDFGEDEEVVGIEKPTEDN